MALDKLPSVLTENKFTDKGLVEPAGWVKTADDLLVPAYVGSQLGFSEAGKYFLNNELYPALEVRCGILPLCPFTACGEYLDFSELSDDMSAGEQRAFWDRFNRVVGPVNYETLMPKAKLMVAVFDGSHAVDDGLASEVAYFAVTRGPIVGIRSDFRLAENPAAPINPAVRYFIDQGPFKSSPFFEGPDAYEKAYEALKEMADKARAGEPIGKHRLGLIQVGTDS